MTGVQTCALPIYKLVDSNALPMAGQAISVSAPGVPGASGLTDGNGKFVFSYTAPSLTGALTISAAAGGDTLDSDVTVLASGGGGVPNASETPQSASLTPTPSVIPVNLAGSTDNQVELRALFVGTNNKPVQNVRVRFDLNNNTTNTDGVVSQLGTYAYSDASGVARGTFTPGQISSPTNGITVRACWATTDFDVNTCPNPITSTLTVTSEALSVSIHTDNLLVKTSNLTYIKKYVVLVVDAPARPSRTC